MNIERERGRGGVEGELGEVDRRTIF